jgi:hypothetical protein
MVSDREMVERVKTMSLKPTKQVKRKETQGCPRMKHSQMARRAHSRRMD